MKITRRLALMSFILISQKPLIPILIRKPSDKFADEFQKKNELTCSIGVGHNKLISKIASANQMNPMS